MAWILLRFERLAAFETREGDHAMRHQNSVFHALLKHVPWDKLEKVVAQYRADKSVRELSSKRHLIALLYAQISGATGLREIHAGMASHEQRLYHLCATPAKRSTLSDANRNRTWRVFGDLFAQMLPQACR